MVERRPRSNVRAIKPRSRAKPPPEPEPKTLAEAVATGDDSALLAALRQRIAQAVADPATKARELAELTRLLIRTKPEEEKTPMAGTIEPPPEMEVFDLWCTNRGLFDTKRNVYTGDRAVWKTERLEWALAHGWPGGSEAFFECENEDDDPRDCWDPACI
jgi:hypothetical protein